MPHPVVFELHVRTVDIMPLEVLAEVAFTGDTTERMRQHRINRRDWTNARLPAVIRKAHVDPFVLFLAVTAT